MYQITVETDYLAYNPLDKIGFQQIGLGDRIYVSGTIDDNLFNKNELIAITISTLE